MWEPSIETALEHEEGSTRRLEVNGGYLYQVKMVMRNYEETPFNKNEKALIGTSVFWSAPVFVPGYDRQYPTTYVKD